MDICRLKNPIQDYAWGSHTAIPELLGQPSPSETPQAELWMGAHPKAPSKVEVGGEWKPLPEVIASAPREILGDRVAKRFGGRLPFLFKILAAAQPLSIQAHPNVAQAREGFARENAEGIPLTAPNRSYKDDNHKPEIICALTPFWAMNGFRKIDEMVCLLKDIGPAELETEIGQLSEHRNPDGLKEFFSTLMTMDKSRQQQVVEQAVAAAERGASGNPIFEWMLKLNEKYPGDIGVLGPVLLNLVKLEPGQAMFLQAGQLHAYLGGVGIELMANSDNVLRGGLTPKHIDVPELLKILRFAETGVSILSPERQDGDRAYPSDAEEFRLSVLDIDGTAPYTSATDRSVEVMICTGGKAFVKNEGSGKTLTVKKGTSLLVPAAVRRYLIEGEATLYKASVP
ncbi:MAG: mannose-6-phosphate isomerase, class I [Planctomycetes bacterium]|nr:mannose-6-phosphate isomerase, class I [Planctomycetota bacterium]